MTFYRGIGVAIVVAVGLGVSGCGKKTASFTGTAPQAGTAGAGEINDDINRAQSQESSIWDVFGPGKTEQTVQVNRYLWAASLDVLGFLPIESVDPFTGVIVTGYGTPPGGGRSYRATVHISDPALSARSLKLAMQTSGGRPANPATVRAVEDAILSRARQLRIADDNL
ncbi:MAG: DUF3576 domain-containing protein [Alphaproteobacteria bacterium]|nr:MAG: DUF3576 domain-containing protein [Alphaproteobacteria bacterium]